MYGMLNPNVRRLSVLDVTALAGPRFSILLADPSLRTNRPNSG